MDEERLETMRHSAAHVMAQAVLELYPDAKLGIGPAISDGFYYDFDLGGAELSADDLPKVEEKMRQLISCAAPFEHQEVSKDEARAVFKDQPYKLELIDDLEDEKVGIYRDGDFTDLCKGPHVASTAEIGAFKLLSTAGAYWRGDEKRPMLTRIYGAGFEKQSELDEYLAHLEEAAKRDHRKLGKELDLFSIHELLGPGLVLYHPKGATVRFLIEDFLKREHTKRGYEFVISPHIMRTEVWKVSGHLDMGYPMYFFDIEGQPYGIKPMNCPGHLLVFKNQPRSYRDLPTRYFELGTVYRHERSGVLHGLLRVRGFTQDYAHIFCTDEQLEGEITGVIEFAFYCLKIFGFEEFDVMLSTRPEKYVGTEESWERATDALRSALEHHDVDYVEDPGEGVFYGPKIDIKLKDAIGRLWQGPTIQVDFNEPERFDIVYWGADNQQHRPVMIHRTVLGSMERFMGALIEHHGGAFPTWLAPVQVVVLPIADRHNDYAEQVMVELAKIGARAELDIRSESTGKKIRDAQLQKTPYMLVVGDREAEHGTVAVRDRSGTDHGPKPLADFIARLADEIKPPGA